MSWIRTGDPKGRILTLDIFLFEKVPAYLLPFGNLLVMMKSQSLELHSLKNRFWANLAKLYERQKKSITQRARRARR